MRHRRLAFAFLLLIAALVSGGCNAGDGTEPATSGSVLLRGNGGDPNSLDPALAEDDHAFRILTDLYEGLVIFDGAGILRPGVAEEWYVSEDGLTYAFHLRSNATWSNGDKVTAEHFVSAFRRALAPDSGSAYAFLLFPIKNSVSVSRGELPVSDLGISAPSHNELVIELESAAPHFVSTLAMPVAFPVHPAASENRATFSEPDRFIGNGPYVLKELQPGHRVRLERNVLFRDAGEVTIDSVEYYSVTNLQTEMNMYRAGELHITASVPGASVAALSANRPSELRISPKLGLYYLAFDLTEAPTDDLALRKALSMAIDREVLATVVGRGEKPAYGLVPSGIPGFEPARYEWRSLSGVERESEARLALAASSYTRERPMQLTLLYDAGDIHEKVALAVSGMWRNVLGIDVELDKREWQYFLDTRDRRDEWQIMRFAWVGDYNHPNTFAELFESNSAQNLPGYRNAEYDAMLLRARESRNTATHASLMHAAESALLDDYPIAPLYFYVSKHLVSPEVRGFDNNALDRHPSRFLSFGDRPTLRPNN